MTRFRRTVLACGAAALAAGLAGCGASDLAAYTLAPALERTVPAEYAHLAGHKLATVVWTHDSTELADPDLRADLAAYVQKRLAADVENLTFCSQSEILRYQATTLHWDSQPRAQLARRFSAEMLLYIEVGYYNLSDPNAGDVASGQMTCKCELLDVSGGGGEGQVVWNKDMTTQWPPEDQQRLGQPRQTRRNLLIEFADRLAKCFYKHKEPA